MRLRKMMKVTVFGAVVEYLMDPKEGAQRRAALRDGLMTARLKVMELADTARPYARNVVSAVLGRSKEIVGEVRRRTQEVPPIRSVTEGNAKSAENPQGVGRAAI